MKLEYIWLDGFSPTANLRSKTKIRETGFTNLIGVNEESPEWGFDGSSTKQAKGNDSDCILKPVFKCSDPLRGEDDHLIFCEVYNKFNEAHESNTRAKLQNIYNKYKKYECWVGFEQEYTLMMHGKPLGFPHNGEPKPQGEYYCGVGNQNIRGRIIVEEHLDACLKAGLKITGINAEVMIGQWEYQLFGEDIMTVCDQLWVSRYLLHKIAEKYSIDVNFHPKPVIGDWNGSGLHVNFSTKQMREDKGYDVIQKVIPALEKAHKKHIKVYGAHNEKRLTGKHETCNIKEFKYGASDRGASIRIPLSVTKEGKGYLEDRRPASNADPYLVASALMETICKTIK